MLNPAIQVAINAAITKAAGNRREITVTFGRTINTGNYNSLRLDTRVTETISKDEDMDEAYRRLWNEAFGQVERAEAAFMKKQKAAVAARNAQPKIESIM